MPILETFANAANTAKRKIGRVLLDTPVEILMGAVLLGGTAGTISYQTNKAREGEIPLAFSEIEHITNNYTSRGQQVPSLTRFYAVNNDVAMKVFESNNIALRQNRDDATFARELRTRVEPGLSEHALISDYARTMRQDAAAARRTLDPVHNAAVRANSISSAFENAWTDSHYDHYRTEWRTRQVCSGSGNTRSCHSESYTVQVYDHTTHTYTYYPAEGSRAQRLIDDYVATVTDVTIPERLVLTDEVHDANLSVITASMRDMLDGELPSPVQALEYANTWARGSTFSKYLPTIYQQHRNLIQSAPAWRNAQGEARSTRYNTWSRSDSGPAAFRVANAARDQAAQLNGASTRITSGITFSASAVPELDRQIRAFIDVALNGRTGDSGEMREDLMELARDIYNRNHENGFDVEPFSWPEVLLFTFLGLLAGAALGYGADRVVAMPTIRDMLLRERPKKGPLDTLGDTPRRGLDEDRSRDPLEGVNDQWRDMDKRREVLQPRKDDAPKPVKPPHGSKRTTIDI